MLCSGTHWRWTGIRSGKTLLDEPNPGFFVFDGLNAEDIPRTSGGY